MRILTNTFEWLPPVAALFGAFGGAWLGNRHSRDSWLRQRRWVNREKYYLDLLAQLKKAELNFERQCEYFEEPGSEHVDYSDDDRFKKAGKDAAEALHSLKELIGPAEVFLSPRAIAALRELIHEEWHAGNDAADRSGYARKVLALVSGAQAAVIEAAKEELGSV